MSSGAPTKNPPRPPQNGEGLKEGLDWISVAKRGTTATKQPDGGGNAWFKKIEEKKTTESSNNNTQQQQPPLSESSILATQFVPQHLRIINERLATAILKAGPASSSGADDNGDHHPPHELFSEILVPRPPQGGCCCNGVGGGQLKSHNDGNNNNNKNGIKQRQPPPPPPAPTPPAQQPQPHVYPMRDVPPELYVGIIKNQPSSTSWARKVMDPQPQLLHVDGVMYLEDYTSVFENLLDAERHELLLRYEQYSQYGIKVIPLTNNGAIPINNSRKNEETFLQAVVDVGGIADASPPLLIGDTVLLRPLHTVSLPIRDPRNRQLYHQQPDEWKRYRRNFGELFLFPRHQQQWSQPIHAVEVQSHVVSVKRGIGGRGGGKDRVVLQWLSKAESNLLSECLRSGMVKHWKERQNIYYHFNVRFVPSVSQHQRCLTALDWLRTTFVSTPQAAMQLLFPVRAPTVPPWNGSTSTTAWLSTAYALNENQMRFVKMVLARTCHPSESSIRGPMILTGPAGTGKTRTMLEALRAVLSLSTQAHPFRILVCTPSQTAANVVTERLGKLLGPDKLFRLLEADWPTVNVPANVLRFCKQDSKTGAFTMPSASELLKFQVIVSTCSDTHLLYRIGLTNQQLRERRRCFQRYLNQACGGRNLECELKGVDLPHFTHLFVDEAAQATEPETLIALSVVVDPLPGNRKVEIALVGDPRQLSPAVYSAKAAHAGLGRSWMERLLLRPVTCLGGGQDSMLGPERTSMEEWLRYSFQHDGQEQLTVFLTQNYRGHSSFLMMPSVLFYSDRLLSVESDKEGDRGEAYWCEKLRFVESLSSPVQPNGMRNGWNVPEPVQIAKQFSWPLHFRGVSGQDTSVTVESGFASSSWANEIEAQTVVEIVVTLFDQGVQPQSIGIMAPFRGQVVLIRKLLRSKNLGGVNVGTVEDYQSVERDVIVLSLTRSSKTFVENDIKHRMGVFGQPKRTNVALTRAEFLFIVVGNPALMVRDDIWRQVLLFCHRNGLHYGEKSGDESLLAWSESRRLVRHQAEYSDPNVVAVGSLERLLRTT